MKSHRFLEENMPLPQNFSFIIDSPLYVSLKVFLPFKETREQFDIASKLFFYFCILFSGVFASRNSGIFENSGKSDFFYQTTKDYKNDYERSTEYRANIET